MITVKEQKKLNIKIAKLRGFHFEIVGYYTHVKMGDKVLCEIPSPWEETEYHIDWCYNNGLIPKYTSDMNAAWGLIPEILKDPSFENSKFPQNFLMFEADFAAWSIASAWLNLYGD